jgi:dolichyl-phosphate-mannose-protein mannosyltransferase
LVGLGLVTRLLFLSTPDSAVFDEVHFGKFISAYFTGEYYFDIHPPLGKLIVAAWGWFWGFRPGFSFANIGDVYPDRMYMLLRLLPALAGALLPVVLYGIARQLGIRRGAAFLAGVLVALDNALLTQSRLILLDSFLLLFGFGAFYAYLRFRNGGHPALLALSGALGGAAMCIKWTGASFLAIIIVWELFQAVSGIRSHGFRRLYRAHLHRLVSLVLVPVALYGAAFAIHFALLPKSGQGDAFMSREFQHNLIGNPLSADSTINTPSFIDKFVDLNDEMFRANQRLTATHPYSSRWFTWPFMERTIFYWVKGDARIYLQGNPVVWWLSTAAVLFALVTVVLTGARSAPRIPLILLGAWALNLLPFVGIGRVMFLYHYFTALVWAILLLVWVVDQMPKANRTAIALGAVALAMFLFFAPLSYGLPLSSPGYEARAWFDSWR